MWSIIYSYIRKKFIQILFKVSSKTFEEVKEIVKPIVKTLNDKNIGDAEKREIAISNSKKILNEKKILYKDNFLMWLLATIIEEVKKDF